jgi:hypothetical protein
MIRNFIQHLVSRYGLRIILFTFFLFSFLFSLSLFNHHFIVRRLNVFILIFCLYRRDSAMVLWSLERTKLWILDWNTSRLLHFAQSHISCNKKCRFTYSCWGSSNLSKEPIHSLSLSFSNRDSHMHTTLSTHNINWIFSKFQTNTIFVYCFKSKVWRNVFWWYFFFFLFSQWIVDTLNFVRQNNVSLDFISTHLYPTDYTPCMRKWIPYSNIEAHTLSY